MRLKKKVKRTLIFLLILIFLITIGIPAIKNVSKKSKDDETIKIVNKVEKYGYQLKENKSKRYKDMFKELKSILKEKNVDEEKYINKLTEMFIYDFYSLEDKKAKTDVGGVDFVYKDILSNFLVNAQNTYYKYIESNIYDNRNQQLPVVDKIVIEEVIKQPFAYGENNDDEAYTVKAKWTYTNEKFSSYQHEAQLVFIHDGIKLSLVELK